MKTSIFVISILSLIIVSLTHLVLADPQNEILSDNTIYGPQTEYFPLNGIIGIEKTSLLFHASEDNSLPWAFVEGKISNPVAGYPVIIQIYRDDEPVHFAQTDVNEDGTYEYKFRVLNIEDDNTTRLFVGDYHVTIFKVVYLDLENSA